MCCKSCGRHHLVPDAERETAWIANILNQLDRVGSAKNRDFNTIATLELMPEQMTHQTSDTKTEPSQQPPIQSEGTLHARYDKLVLMMSVARLGIKGMLRINPSSAKCLDIGLSGIQFNNNQQFSPDEKLVLDLCVHETELKELNTIVLDSQEHEEDRWCKRAKFCFQTKQMQKPGVTNNLRKMVDRLRAEHEFPLVTV